MKRDINQLTNTRFDLLVIGAGIYGATIAWDAVLRGLTVALIEKDDFGSSTSSNSLKIIHGGLRYLQHLDLKRMRESITERRVMSQIAPHLVHPLPCIMPTRGHGIKGPEAMRVALLLNDLVGYDRNKLDDPQKRLPRGRVLSREETLKHLPFIDSESVNGGALWYDAYMANSERLLYSFIQSAQDRGACVVNHLRVTDFVRSGDTVVGVRAVDSINEDQSVELHARMTVNTAGPWINTLIRSLDPKIRPEVEFSTALNLVINRSLTDRHAFGVSSPYVFRDADTIISKGSRLLFAVPWRGATLVGTAHKPFRDKADSFKVTEDDIQGFLDEINRAMPGAHIKRDEVVHYYGGLLPMEGIDRNTGDVRLKKHFHVLDHEAESGIRGVLSVVSVKYTTARGVAEEVVNRVFKTFGRKVPHAVSQRVPIWGGEIDRYDTFLADAIRRYEDRFNADFIQHLIRTYGSTYETIIHMIENNPDLSEPIADNQIVCRAEVIHAVRKEMALTLSDVIMRRTEAGSLGHPGMAALSTCADIMAQELGWGTDRLTREIATTDAQYHPAMSIVEQEAKEYEIKL